MNRHETTQLSKADVEQLCRMYMDCQLSVLEETELQYVLGKIDYTSPLIDETRMLMGISLRIRGRSNRTPKIWRRRNLFAGIAASLLIAIVIGNVVAHPNLRSENDDVYIAYAGGNRLGNSRSRIQVETDMTKAKEFMSHMETLQKIEQQKLNDFMINNSTSK